MLYYTFNYKGLFNLNSCKRGGDSRFDVSQLLWKRDATFIVFSAPNQPKSNPRVWWTGYYTNESLLDHWGSMYTATIGKRGNIPAKSRRQYTTSVSCSSQAAALVPVKDSDMSATSCMVLPHFHSLVPVESRFTPFLWMHGVWGHADPTMTQTAPPLTPYAVAPIPDSPSTSPVHLLIRN